MHSEDPNKGWILTSEQMPEEDSRENVLFYNKYHDQICIGWYESRTLCWVSSNINSSREHVPFWKPLPPLPEHLISFKDPKIARKIAAQNTFCWDSNKYKLTPRNGECYVCDKQIFRKISLKKASSEVIKVCPYCNHKFSW